MDVKVCVYATVNCEALGPFALGSTRFQPAIEGGWIYVDAVINDGRAHHLGGQQSSRT
jgi:hypothetical protein